MEKLELLYEGSSKKVFRTEDPDLLLIDYRNGAGSGGKTSGAVNNRISNYIFRFLEQEGIPTHYVQELSDTETVVKKAEMLPLKVVIRNIAAGSICKKLGIEAGSPLLAPTLELLYKADAAGDTMINDYYAAAVGAATMEELARIAELAFLVNERLIGLFSEVGMELVDAGFEFGRYKGQIILADEISPGTCRFLESSKKGQAKEISFGEVFGKEKDIYEILHNRFL